MRKLLKKCKDAFYHLCVRRVPQIRTVYEGYVDTHKQEHRRSRLKSWMLLLRLNLNYYLFRKVPEFIQTNEERGEIKVNISESYLSKRETPEQLCQTLSQYDVISFDIFDTLIFRPFALPEDLFYILEEKQNYLDFKRLRMYAEWKARERKKKNFGTYEVTLYDIYDYLEEYIGIEAKSGAELEFETELELCYANPYMKQVVTQLIQQGKTVIVMSDMYLTKDLIEKLLYHCGYSGFAELFVSCDQGLSKYEGTLYSLVKKKFGKQKTYIHVGDNPNSDQKRAKENDFDVYFYQNVTEAGIPQRSSCMSYLVGSAYKGIVNSHFHNGIKQYSMAYEYGFACGGLFVLGYCMFVHRYAQTNGIDKVLFLARDGEILKKVYDQLFPGNNSEYVYWSRMAAVKLTAYRFRYDFFRRFIYHRINTDITLKQAVQAMELESVFSVQFTKRPEFWKRKLDDKGAKLLETLLLEKWEQILEVYEEQSKAAKQYFQQILKGCQKVCAVDVGWAGSGAISLSTLVEQKWQIPCRVYGMIAGTNTPHNAEPDASEALLQSGRLVSYLFSHSFNRDALYHHNPKLDHNVYFEFLLSSCEGSLKGFCFDESGKPTFRFGKPETANHKVVLDIQQGILDFIQRYQNHFKKYPYLFDISGSDAYMPFQLAASYPQYFNQIFDQCTFQLNLGDDNRPLKRQ